MQRLLFHPARHCLILLSLLISCAEAGPAQPEDMPPALRVCVGLKDGSRINGTLLNESLRFRSALAEVSVPLKTICTLKVQGENDEATIEFRNGDRLRGELKKAHIKLMTLGGEADIEAGLIRSLEVLSGAATPQEVRAGLVLHLSFDRDEGQRVSDLSGCGNHATLRGAKRTLHGKLGGGCVFDGDRDCIEVPDRPSLRISKQVTVTVWIKTERKPTSSGWAGIVCKGNHGERNYELQLSQQNYPQWHYMTDGISRWNLGNDPPVADGAWHHLVGTWDGATAVLYVDGEKRMSSAWSEPLAPNHHPLLIGFTPGYEFTHFPGVMDEIMVFTRALPPEEVRQLYGSQR